MPKKGDRQVQIKRTNFQIKQALLIDQRFFSLFLKWPYLINKIKVQIINQK